VVNDFLQQDGVKMQGKGGGSEKLLICPTLPPKQREWQNPLDEMRNDFLENIIELLLQLEIIISDSSKQMVIDDIRKEKSKDLLMDFKWSYNCHWTNKDLTL
jgi:hypothetical protein